MGTRKANKKVFLLICLKARPSTSVTETDIYGCCLATDIKEAIKKFQAIGHRFLSESDTVASVRWDGEPPKWFGRVTAEALNDYESRWNKVRNGGNWCVEFMRRLD